MIYVASPFSHEDPLIQKTRFLLAESFVIYMIKQENLIVFSPIVYGYRMTQENNLPGDADFWSTFNLNLLRRCNTLFNLQLKGWQESKGVQLELNVAKILRIPVVHFNADFTEINPELEASSNAYN
jgi:hypothetical protein